MKKVEYGWFLAKALLFGQNMVFFGSLYCVLAIEERWIWTIFGENGKPIALLLGQNMVFFGTF